MEPQSIAAKSGDTVVSVFAGGLQKKIFQGARSLGIDASIAGGAAPSY